MEAYPENARITKYGKLLVKVDLNVVGTNLFDAN